MESFNSILKQYREVSFSERDKGDRFERLMQAYLLTDPKYSALLDQVWLWNEFPSKADFGGKDIGIDLVALTYEGDFWAIQCKCFEEDSVINKKSVDSFLSTSSKLFQNLEGQTVGFTQRIWISTTNNWGPNAEEAIRNQNPPVTRINLYDLEQAPVDWQQLQDGLTGEHARSTKKSLRAHQQDALNAVHDHFKANNRGKLIMACGTGKTYTSLKIAENETKNDGLVLFLVPSIALLGQTLREWTGDSEKPIYPIAICSDSGITKKRNRNVDSTFDSVIDLAYPASTDVKNISKQFRTYKEKQKQDEGMIVVFSTYQSIDVIAAAQTELLDQGINAEFDLIICDEAHRTTGVALTKESESSFTKVHDNEIIKSKKRLYMTATPRLYDDNSKSKAAQSDAYIWSMDDETLYGQEVYRIGFGEAVERDLLTDYKVLILTMSDRDVPALMQKIISDENSEITADDASKLIGCINAMSKQVLGDEGLIKSTDPDPMQRAVAFCQNIKISKRITNTFNETADIYLDSEKVSNKDEMVTVSAKHIDGTMNAPLRDELLGWLKSNDRDRENECRVLTNVRCLSEGVDVPSLDSVLFLSARNSQVDVVQSVGRVMRKAPGKKYGYIVIPVVVPYDVEPEKVLNDNERFKVVWTVLNALRAHDDRFNATINKIDLNKRRPSQIIVGEVGGGDGGGDDLEKEKKALSTQLHMQFQELQGVMYAKMVQKVGDRVYWEKWASDVADIAKKQIDRIKYLVEEDSTHQNAFSKFLEGLQKNINPSISKDEAIEMLSQHIITKPVFEALFEGYSFVENNAVSKAMQSMLNVLESTRIEKDTETLNRFYESVRKRAEGIDNAEGKQRIIYELYDKFFKTGFPKMVDQLGIVYTPIEVVDFIIHSVNDVLQTEFNRTVSDKNVHILDPFTGTGTFITRLLQSGLIKQEDLHRKYTQELHANEIVLLAYYIAAVNIENAYHDATEDPDDGIGKENFTPFDGIVLTDTFQLGESDGTSELFSEMFPQNSERVQKQKEAPITVIIGNPPYSASQKSREDDAQNLHYSNLHNRIQTTYAVNVDTQNINKLYDSYIKAFRWSTDKLPSDEGGIIAFVTNSTWLDSSTMAGFRKCLQEEFSDIFVYNLRGNQRTQGEISRKEGGKIFGSGSRTPVAITILVKKPNIKKSNIYYKDIGDYLSREEKLDILRTKESVTNIDFKLITPNRYNDWINNQNELFVEFPPLDSEEETSYFKHRTIGIQSNGVRFNTFNRNNFNLLELDYAEEEITLQMYRPFCKKYFLNNNTSVYRPGKWKTINAEEGVIICTGKVGDDGFSCLMSVDICDYQFIKNGYCYALSISDQIKNRQDLFSLSDHDDLSGINDQIIKEFQSLNSDASDKDVFHYIYAMLHSKTYLQLFKNNLKKQVPRIPIPVLKSNFDTYVDLGQKLSKLHTEYELVDRYDDLIITGESSNNFNVQKMKYGKTTSSLKKGVRSQIDRSVIIFNNDITISNIPPKAHDYVVNGKSAIQWIIESYQVKRDKKTNLVDDPNIWAKEVGNPRYILDLLLSIINVSVQTVDIVDSLPSIDFENL